MQQINEHEFDPRWVRILEATSRLFLRYGYLHTSMKAIADAAHVSKATLYAYWSTKPELFNSLILWESLHTFDDWLQRVQSDPMGDRLGYALAHGMAAVSANPVLHVLYSRDTETLGDLLRERGTRLTTQRYGMTLSFIQALQDEGIIRTDLPAEHINHILTAISVGLVSVGELYDSVQFPAFENLATSLGAMIQSALEPVEVRERRRDTSVIIEYLTQQRQTTLNALLVASQPREGKE